MPASWKTLCSCIPQRWVIIAMCLLINFTSMNMHVCLSITITEMVLSTNETSNSSTKRGGNESYIEAKKFDWDERTQGLILSSFSCGYIVTSLISGLVVYKLNGKRTIGVGLLFASVLTLLTPVIVEWGGHTAFIILRLLLGFADGFLISATVKLMAHWIPEDERSWATTFTFSGITVGNAFGISASGIILQRSAMGWPAVFYFFGILGMASLMLFYGLCYNSPSEHPFISIVEKNYLKDKLRHTHKNLPSTPWRHMMRSKSFWAIAFANIAASWAYTITSADLPKFMKSVLKVPVEINGYMSSLPYVCSLIFIYVASGLADIVIAKKIATIGCTRKIGSSIAFLGTPALLIIATYVSSDHIAVLILLVFAMMMYSCIYFGTAPNSLDLTPNYASSLQGVLYGCATITSFLSPYFVGLLAPEQTVTQWRHVFFLMLTVCAASNLVFVIFGSGEVQNWNDPNFLRRDVQIEKSDLNAIENKELLFIK